ncbi:MAG: AsmA family protein, partial [Thermodesulfovibrio sp.]|nr:AsmA family protein [Thermodesulfovibrio sp.]
MKKIFFIATSIIFVCLVALIKIDVTSLILTPIKKELKEITGLDISIKNISLHIIPLHIEIENLEFVSNKDDRDNFNIKKVKLYFSIYEIFKKEINIKRILISNSQASLNYEFLKECIDNVENYLNKPSPIPFKVKIHSFEIENLTGILYKGNLELKLNNLRVRSILKPDPIFKIISNLKVKSPDYPNIDTNIKADFKIKDDKIILNELKIFDIYSLIKTDGNLNYSNFLGEFFITGKIFLNSIKNFLGIKDKFSGEINLDGKILFKNAQNLLDKIYLDIDFDAKFFLQEFMKILKVSEKLEGYTEIFNGKLKGPLSNIKITADAKQKDGNILGVKNQTVSTEILYSNGILEFKNGYLTIYGGKAKAYVWITLPKVTEHYVFVEVKNISSYGIFEIIKWNPGIAEGVLDGWLLSQGNVFAPKGSFIYFRKGTVPTDIRGKINTITGEFESDGEIYKFSSLNFQLNNTNLNANGLLDAKKMFLNFKFQGETKNINEILLPYQDAFSGDTYFNGSLYGKVEDPEIDLNCASNTLKIDLNSLTNLLGKEPLLIKDLKGHLKYRKNNLIVSFHNSENISINGNINFPRAKNLFDFSMPDYNITFTLKDLFAKDLYIEKFNNFLIAKINLSGYVKGQGIIETKAEIGDVIWGKEKIVDKVNASLKYQKNILKINEAVIIHN